MVVRLLPIAVLVFAVTLVGCSPNQTGNATVEKGLSLLDQRNFADAIPLFKEALTEKNLDYSRSTILTAIGNCYNELDQFEESLRYHELALEGDPENHQAHVNKGVVYRQMGEYDKAAECYTEALRLAPDYAELHASMGALSLFQADVDGAIIHLERAVELDDNMPGGHFNLAIAYASADRFDDAVAELEKAIQHGYHQPERARKMIEQFREQADEVTD